jgi:hypothetical protein
MSDSIIGEALYQTSSGSGSGGLPVDGIQITGNSAVVDLYTPSYFPYPGPPILTIYYEVNLLVGPTLTIDTVNNGPEIFSGVRNEVDGAAYGTSTLSFTFDTLTGIPIVLTNAGSNSVSTLDNQSVNPFSSLTLSGFSSNLNLDSLTVTPNKTADGTLSDPAGGQLVNGSYVLTGTLSSLQAALRELSYTPTEHQVPAGQQITTDFNISVTTPQGQVSSYNDVSVTATALNYINGSVNGHATLVGTGGGDIINAHGEGNVIFGNGGSDIITAGSGSDLVVLGSGSATVTLAGSHNAVTGGSANVTVNGTADDNNFIGLGNGHDSVNVGGLNDKIILGNGGDNVTGTVGMAFIATGSGNDTLSVQGLHNTIDAGGGQNTISGINAFSTYVLNGPGHGFDTISDFSPYVGNKLDLTSALAATNWNGKASTLGGYISVTDTGGNATIAISTTSGGTGVGVASLHNDGSLSLATLLQTKSLTT